MPYDLMQPEDIIEMRFDHSVVGNGRPSTEWRFHLDILRARPEVSAVVHAHPVYCTTLAIMERSIPPIHYMVCAADPLRALRAPRPWRAHFVSVLALAWPDGRTETFEGRVDGDLVFPPRGTAGFGYDPIFRPDGHARTFGEMSAEEKHGIPPDGSLALSHRARAFQKFAHACL